MNIKPVTRSQGCNPPLLRRAIEVDPDIGLLLPCNVIAKEAIPYRIPLRQLRRLLNQDKQ